MEQSAVNFKINGVEEKWKKNRTEALRAQVRNKSPPREVSDLETNSREQSPVHILWCQGVSTSQNKWTLERVYNKSTHWLASSISSTQGWQGETRTAATYASHSREHRIVKNKTTRTPTWTMSMLVGHCPRSWLDRAHGLIAVHMSRVRRWTMKIQLASIPTLGGGQSKDL